MTAQERDNLITSYLERVAGLLRRFAASAQLDVNDLEQEATIVIMRCLTKKPEQASQLHGYIYVSVRNRIIDLIRYRQRRPESRLDAPIGTGESTTALVDLLPSPYQVEPSAMIVAQERLQELQSQLDQPKNYQTRRMLSELHATALASREI